MQTVAVMQAEEAYKNLVTTFMSVFGEINQMVKSPIFTINEQEYTAILYLCRYATCNVMHKIAILTIK